MKSKLWGAGDMDSSEITPLEFEEDIATANSSLPDSKFDSTVGHIEDIIMEGDFQELQHHFLQKYYHEFDDTEENKFVYTDIHKEYVELVERYLQQQLAERMPEFSMAEFQKQLIDRKEELEGEVFEMLLTFSDFLSFKEMVIDFKNEKEGNTVDLSGGLCVRSLSHDPSHMTPGTNSSSLPPRQQSAPPTSGGLVHNLDIGGQSFMISAGGGATNVDLFGAMAAPPTQQQSNHINLGVNMAPQSVTTTSSSTANGAFSQQVIGNHSTKGEEEAEAMNISPRPQQMDQ